jgi:DNA polymerase V
MRSTPCKTRLALVDGNNFYVSCERVFRPDLIGKPVGVLSNGDGICSGLIKTDTPIG